MKPGTLLLSAILLAASAAAQDSETSSIVIIGDRFIDATGTGVNEDYAVVIQGERIAEVGPKDRVRIPAGAEVIDVSGATVLPGLADVHVHPAFYLAGPREFEDDSLSALRASAILRQALDAGITLMRDLGARHNVGIGLKHALAKGYIEGPRLIVANGVRCHRSGSLPRTRPESGAGTSARISNWERMSPKSRHPSPAKRSRSRSRRHITSAR